MRGKWVAGALTAGTLALLVAFFRPRATEEFPLADLVPADAAAYAGFPDYRQLESLLASFPGPESAAVRKGIDEARPHLAGAAALYLDRQLEPVLLLRLKRASAIVTRAETEGDALILTAAPAALERHRSRRDSILENGPFRILRSRLFVNLNRLPLSGRLRDFSAAGFEFAPGPPLLLSGRVLYHGSAYPLYLQKYVQMPRLGAPEGTGAVFVESFQRLWDEAIQGLSSADRERVDYEAGALSRDFLGGGSFHDFIGRLGPSWGLSLLPGPALGGWVDFPDAQTRDTAMRMLHRTAQDLEGLARSRGEAPPFEVTVQDSLWRVTVQDPIAIRRKDAFTPAYTFRGNRLIFSTRADTLPDPSRPQGEVHAAVSIDVSSALEAARGLAETLTDLSVLPEAERDTKVLLQRAYSPSTVEAKRRQLLTRFGPAQAAFELAKFLEGERVRLVAERLEELSRTPAYAERLAERRRTIDAWGERLSRLSRISLEGRYTGAGLELQFRAWPR